ncbi:MAG TPA: hypothetical protein QF564_11930, partial [Pirellulaceae bacterium]|nr:hypothetical protein [Pirellulaceae bacterium]
VIKALDERDKQVLLQDLRKRQTDMSDKGSAEQIKDVLRNLENERQLPPRAGPLSKRFYF